MAFLGKFRDLLHFGATDLLIVVTDGANTFNCSQQRQNPLQDKSTHNKTS